MAKAESSPETVSADDLAFWSYVAKEDRPVTLHGLDEEEAEEEFEEEEIEEGEEGEGEESDMDID